MTDPIADMLTRIRNGAAARKKEVVLPMSKLKYEVAKILEQEKWIKKVEVIDPGESSLLKKDGKEGDGGAKKDKQSNFKQLRIVLKYKKSGKPAISFIKKVSKPGLKVYVKKNELPKVLNDFGVAVISTPQGLMTNKTAREKGVGGEVLCEIY